MPPDDLLTILTGQSAPPAADVYAMGRAEAQRQNVDPELVHGLIHQESGGDHSRVSPKGAVGAMQLMPKTAAALGVDPHDPAENIRGGVTYLRQQLDRFGDPRLALAAYNAGPEAVTKHGGVPPYPETENYVNSILGPGPNGDLASILGVAPEASAKAPSSDALDKDQAATLAKLTGDDPNYAFQDSHKPTNAAQGKTLRTLEQGGILAIPKPGVDQADLVGTVHRPYVQVEAGVVPEKPGVFYVDIQGKLKQVPPGPDGEGNIWSNSGSGLLRGGADVAQSIGDLIPGAKRAGGGAVLEANRLVYDATHHDLASGAGRFLGQAIPTTVLLATGEGALAPVSRVLGGAGTFLAGNAGRAALPAGAGLAARGGNLLLRGASLGTSGALEGAAAGALNNASTDASLGQDILTGAEFGAALKPAIPAIVGGARKLLPNAERGAAPLEEQNRLLQAEGRLPVPVPLTKGMISGAPAQQMAENAMLRGLNGDKAAMIMQDAAAARQGALRDNVGAIENRLTGAAPADLGAGGVKVSDKLNAMRDAAKAKVDEAYGAARETADGAYLPASERPVVSQRLRESVRDYDPEMIAPLTRALDKIDGSPTSGTLTPTDLFEARARIGTMRAGNDPILGGAAGKAVKELDSYISDALKADLISGDPKAVEAWRKAIGARRDMGKIFEGKDLVQALTKRAYRGEEQTLAVAPEDAANYIFGKSGLNIDKKDLTRDLIRLKGVLGPGSPEWDALRAEAFKRIAKAGEGSPENGAPQFSGQNFMKAWEAAKTKNPQIINQMFSPDERALIDNFAHVAQRATTPVKGGDNPSNSAVAAGVLIKQAAQSLLTMTGGAAGSIGGPGGAAAGAGIGKMLDALFRDFGAVAKANKAVSPKLPGPVRPSAANKFLRPGVLGSALGNKLLGAPSDSTSP